MKLFECQHCGQPLYFENIRCESCGRSLGYLPSKEAISALERIQGKAKEEGANQDGANQIWQALADPGARYRYCANVQQGVCNWLVDADSPENFCLACRHNRMIPNLSTPENLANWQKMEIAKHRLFYTLLKLRLPLATRTEDPDGLAFDFLEAPSEGMHTADPVLTGHASGLITINLAEADDSKRERQRSDMGEPYRTLLGHFRHEIAHYYWDRLVAQSPMIEKFREVFGDEGQDYSEALQRHYAEGPPGDWPERFVTAYASVHPWEDFAETWAHYFHMVDTLETAGAFGLRLRPKVSMGAELATVIDFDPHAASIGRIVMAWLPITFAANSINRSMGLNDLYPFVLTPPVIVKLAFIHECVHPAGQPGALSKGALRAVLDGLKRAVGGP
jgi:hypothetical protein